MTHEEREIHRKKRILEYAERIGNINKTCRYFGIARSTFYLWRERYRQLGEEGLRSRRCGPHNHPNNTPDEVVEKIVHLRRTYHMGRFASSGTCSATTASGRPMRPSIGSANGMASTDFRTEWDVVPCTRIATRSRFPATTCRST